MLKVENLNEKHKNNGKGKETLSDQIDKEGNNLGSDHVAAESYNREELDEMWAVGPLVILCLNMLIE